MITQEITLHLPPADLAADGTILARQYPLTIAGSPEAWRVDVQDIYIAPSTGMVEVRMSGAGVSAERRHTLGAAQTALPQATATQMQPLTITLSNLNPDADVHVVIVLDVVETLGGRPGSTHGGPVRFRGAYPLGTDGEGLPTGSDLVSQVARTIALAWTQGDDIAQADGHWFRAFLVRNAPFTERSIRDVTGQVRVLSATGTGSIDTGGTSTVTIIVKRDGTTVEASTGTIDFSSLFTVAAPGGGVASVDGFTAGAIIPADLAYPTPTVLNDDVVATNNTSGVMAELTPVLAAGDWKYTVDFRLEGYGDSGPVDGFLIASAPSTGKSRGTRYEDGVDAERSAVGTGTFTSDGVSASTFQGTYNVTSGTFDSTGGQLIVTLWKVS